MEYATNKNTEIGDIVSIPINGEHMYDEQMCMDYEIVKCFKLVTPTEDQIVGTDQEPLPEYILFNEEMAYKK